MGCVCGSDKCTGADGNCYSGRYEVVETGFTLTNKKFSDCKMYMPATAMFDHMKTTCMPLMEGILGNKLNFILHKLPGKLNGHSQYFLTTEMYPDTVATERATKGTAIA